MTDRPRKQPSLRDLAKRLGCSHSSLSEQIHARLLTAGVSFDHRGRAIVTDIDAAARQWNGLPAARTNEAIVLTDPTRGWKVTALEVFEERDAQSVLVTALAHAAIAGATDRAAAADALQQRVAEHLRAVAELHGSTDDDIARAEDELADALALLRERDEDDEDNNTKGTEP